MLLNSTKISILYIDDEEENLSAFKAGFRRQYEIFTATSAAKALSILNEQKVHVIIADQRMPQSTGVEFFDIVRKVHPNPIRILLTGYADIEVVIAAINKGQIFRYVKKPWDTLELQTTINNAYEIYSTRLKLKNKVEELERANDELNRFVYSTSHDLRSPLASIMGVLSLAQMENSVVDPNGYMGMIETCVKKMDFFTIKVIEYYRSKKVDKAVETINFTALADASIEVLRLQNPAIKFTFTLNQMTEFQTDTFRLSVILDNLLSNAVKYQKPQESNPCVKLSITVNEEEAEIVIEDNGVGIIEEHVNNIFQMFFRSNNSVTGLGIGLYIVKEALTRIGGEIEVKSSYGAGTTFKISVPNSAKHFL
ncbi:MAG: hybrid sensor histidine kinase/response regulator [Segetibacter sp.]|jgi:signal transduction histidine kinase|nr:hybrid sensor histidine kinase/response regulator [Segetibacter sp.]